MRFRRVFVAEKEIRHIQHAGRSFGRRCGQFAVDIDLGRLADLEHDGDRRIGKRVLAADGRFGRSFVGVILELDGVVRKSVEQRVRVGRSVQIGSPPVTGDFGGAELHFGRELLPLDQIHDALREVDLRSGVEIRAVLELVLPGCVGNVSNIIVAGQIRPCRVAGLLLPGVVERDQPVGDIRLIRSKSADSRKAADQQQRREKERNCLFHNKISFLYKF